MELPTLLLMLAHPLEEATLLLREGGTPLFPHKMCRSTKTAVMGVGVNGGL